MNIERLAQLKQEAIDLENAIEDLHTRVNEFLRGVPITIIDEKWNGQPIGLSWPKLKGKTFAIDHCIIEDGQIKVWFKGSNHYCYMPLSYGELIFPDSIHE